jgi:hypothetical protein
MALKLSINPTMLIMKSKVLKKILIGNPLANFELWDDLKEHNQIKTPEELVNFYHKMLDKHKDRKLIYHYIMVMISFSCGVDVNQKIPSAL